MVTGTRQRHRGARPYKKGRYVRKLMALLLCAGIIKLAYGVTFAAGDPPAAEKEVVAYEKTEAAADTAPDADAGIAFTYAYYSDLVGGAPGAESGRGGAESLNSGESDTAAAARDLASFVQGSRATLGEVSIDNYTSKTLNLDEIMTHLQTMDKTGDGPLVLIVHTHTSEAYTPDGADIYTTSDTARTEDTNYNMVRVGDEIAAVLNAEGVRTVHDGTLHDYPSYTGSYGRSLETVEKWLKEYPSIRVVLDVHRDAVELNDGSMLRTGATLTGGERSAQVMLVVGTDDTGLEHPGWKENLAFAVSMQQALLMQGDNFARDINLSSNRYNQHLTPFSLIVEVGSSGNTLQEALTCARTFAMTAAEVIKEM